MKFAFRTLIFVGLFYAIAPLAYAETSLDELQQQADRGDMNAQFQLGRKYHIGDGVERDVEKAVFWYQKAAAQGSAKATNNLGVLYEHGHVAPEDEHRSVEWIMENHLPILRMPLKRVSVPPSKILVRLMLIDTNMFRRGHGSR
ncbi:tetratricopeptide repeat protein [Salmonella enterica]|uniref:tetratricopeptide repeat protein n=1 Tax=Salmonella enterica TaxID=28901 RepID=UPI00209BD1E9|nr:tetratricopeptide repeat protein [Salmonella enterica]